MVVIIILLSNYNKYLSHIINIIELYSLIFYIFFHLISLLIHELVLIYLDYGLIRLPRTFNLNFTLNFHLHVSALFSRSLAQISYRAWKVLDSKTGASEYLIPCPFHEGRVFNFPRKNTTHKSGGDKKGTRRNTQSASKRTSGILRSCEMCKSRQKTFSLIFRATSYRKKRCHPYVHHIIPLIYLRHPVYLSHATAHFSLTPKRGETKG